MKPKSAQALLFVGIGTAIVAGTFIAISVNLERTAVPEVKKIVVLVPYQNLEVGTLFTRPLHGRITVPFVENQFPLDTVPKDAVRTYAELEGQRLVRPLNRFQIVTRRDLIADTQYMAARTKIVTLKNLAVRFGSDPNWLVSVWSTVRHDQRLFHGLLGYVQGLQLMESPPQKYGLTLVRLEGVRAYIRLLDVRSDLTESWYAVTIQVTPEEAESIAQTQKTRRINVCQLEHWPTESPRTRYGRQPDADSFFIFCKQLSSGVLAW